MSEKHFKTALVVIHMKKQIQSHVEEILIKQGYKVKSLHYCFDILARKNGRILLIKVLEDKNALASSDADEMKSIASVLHASPLVIAEKAGSKLHDNIVYQSFGIPVVTASTFSSCIQDSFPVVQATSSGMAVQINKENFQEMMDISEYSPSALSRKIGISAKMLAKYRQGSLMSLHKAFRLYELLGSSVFHSLDIFHSADSPGKCSIYASRKFIHLGFNATEAEKAPCDIIARREDEIILTTLGDALDKNLGIVSKLLDADDLVIFRKKKPKEVPALTKEEFLEFKKARELIRFVKDYN